MRILVGFAPGGSADIAARLLGERLAAELKQPVVVENKPGAGGRIAAEALKNAAADGSTLMLAPIVVPVLAPLVLASWPTTRPPTSRRWRRWPTTSSACRSPAAHPAKNVTELVAWWKANPKEANFGSPAPGSLPHFFGVMIASGTGLDLVHVPFNGGGPLMNALVGNQVSSASTRWSTRSRCTAAARSASWPPRAPRAAALLPEVPTFAESGFKGIEGSGWFARVCAGQDPAATVQQLNAAVNKALAAPSCASASPSWAWNPLAAAPRTWRR